MSFVDYINSLSKATLAAILAAISSVQTNLQVNAIENKNPYGADQLGAFTIVIDNGTGSPPSELITAVYNAVYAVRAFSIQPYVVAVSTTSATIALNIKVASGYTAGSVEASVKSAIAGTVNVLPIGGTLYISAVEAAALTVDGVVSVEPANTTINSVQADAACTQYQAIRTTTGAISVGTY